MLDRNHQISTQTKGRGSILRQIVKTLVYIQVTIANWYVPNREAITQGTLFRWFPREVWKAPTSANKIAASRTFTTLPFWAIKFKCDHKSFSALANASRIPGEGSVQANCPVLNIPMGTAIARRKISYFKVNMFSDGYKLDSVRELRNISARNRPYTPWSVNFAMRAFSSAWEKLWASKHEAESALALPCCRWNRTTTEAFPKWRWRRRPHRRATTTLIIDKRRYY